MSSMLLQKIKNPNWRNLGRSDEHPDFYAAPQPEPDPEEERNEAIDEYIEWFGDDTDAGNQRLRTTIENSLP